MEESKLDHGKKKKKKKKSKKGGRAADDDADDKIGKSASSVLGLDDDDH